MYLRIEWQIVRRITNEILGDKRLTSSDKIRSEQKIKKMEKRRLQFFHYSLQTSLAYINNACCM